MNWYVSGENHMAYNHSDKYRLNPAVFYRTYDDCVVVYDTRARKVYTFNDTVGAILECFADYISLTEVVNRLLQLYDVEDIESFENDIKQFTQELEQKGLIKKQYTQVESSDNLEQQLYADFADVNRLYSATIELTYKCNEKCRHCYITEDNRVELNTEKIKSILDDLSDMNVLNIVFTGGDIFTRSDAFEILEYANSKRFVVDILTNGNLLNGSDCIRLKQLYPRCIHFSVYSHIPEKHDAITQVKGSFAKTLYAIKACSSIGIPVNLKTPVFSETLEDVPGIVELANEIGCTVEISRNITPKKNGDLTPLKMEIKSEADNIGVIETIWNLIPETDSKPENTVVRERNCGAGSNSISISPYGEVFPCIMLSLCVGNVYEQSIKEIWENSVKLKWWRNQNKRSLRKGCETCEYAEKCRYCPGESMMWTGDPLSKYEAACFSTQYLLAVKTGK